MLDSYIIKSEDASLKTKEDKNMKDLMKVADIIKNRIEKDYVDDVSIFAYYGSYAQGTNDAYSDLDFFFIPKSERGKELTLSFLIDGSSFDLFPISWERIARIVGLEQPLTAVLTKSKVIYSASEEDLLRYETFVDKLDRMYDPVNSEFMLSKSDSYVKDSIVNLYNMEYETQDTTSMKIESQKLLLNILHAVSLANNKYFVKSLGAFAGEAFKYDHLPQDFEKLVLEIIQSNETELILSLSKQLLTNTKNFVQDKILQSSEIEPYETLFVGYYEELKAGLDKVIRACDAGDVTTAFIRGAAIQEETARFLCKSELGPWFERSDSYASHKSFHQQHIGIDLMAHMNDLESLKKDVMTYDAKFRSFLESKGIKIADFESLEAFEKHYMSGSK